jgi:dienelactone hydrolase
MTQTLIRLPRRSVLLVALLLTLLVLAPAHSARAEVIDFDPQTGDVPDVVPAPDRELLTTLRGAGYKYLMAEPSPDGKLAYAYLSNEGPGFINLVSGDWVAMQDDAMQPLGDWWWQDEVTLGAIAADGVTDSQGTLTGIQLYKVLLDAESGTVDTTELALWPPTVQPVAASPDLTQVLAAEVPTGTAAATLSTIRPRYGPASELPDSAPGVLGDLVPSTLRLQQSAVKLQLRPSEGTGQQELGSLPAGTSVNQLSWSADSKRLVLTSSTMPDWDGDRQRNNEPPGAGLPNLGSINVQEALGNVKPADNPILTGTRLHVYDTAKGSSLKVLENKDYPEGWLQNILFAPDHAHALLIIATRADLEGRTYPTYAYPGGVSYWLLDGDLKPIRQVTGPDLDSLNGAVGWADASTLYFATPHELDTRVALYDTTAGQLRTVWQRPGSSWQVLAAGGRLVFPRSAADEPMELWAASLSDVSGTAKALTSDGADVAEASRLKTADVTWTGSDGRLMTGRFVYREDMPFPPAKPGPVVVWQQGGPGGQIVDDFGTSVEAPYSLLPQFGIPVFMANAAGRSVQDAQFFSDMAEGRNFGQLDIKQVKEGVEELVRRRLVDPERVGITGCSYGGYFTLQSVRTYPDFYAAANAQCSLMDLFEEFTFGYTPFVSYLMGRAPMADPDEYSKDAPLYGAKDVTTPMLLFDGTEDFLPVALNQVYHDDLDARGVPVTFLRVEGEGHGFQYEATQDYAAQLQLKFFRDLLGVADTSPAGGPKGIFLPVLYSGQP